MKIKISITTDKDKELVSISQKELVEMLDSKMGDSKDVSEAIDKVIQEIKKRTNAIK